MNTQFKSCYDWCITEGNADTFDELLQEISVVEVAQLENHDDNEFLQGWYAIINTEGIIAYFGEESEALRFRLDYINRLLNQ